MKNARSGRDRVGNPGFLMSFRAFFRVCSRSHLAALSFFFVAAVAQAQPASEPAGPRFDILEFRVEGNTVLPAEPIERSVYPFMGEKRSVDDVESARQSLEAAYRKAGFGTVVVDTPEQQIKDGVVTLQVIEAPVSRLRVVGARYYSQGRILEKVPALAEGSVPNFKEVSTQLATVNRSLDRGVSPMLRPGKEPGTTEVDLMVEDQRPLHGSLELNNNHSPDTTSSRLLASMRYDNLWQLEHSIGVQVQVSPEDTSQVKVYSGSYTIPAGNGLVVLSAIRSNSNTVAGVGGTTVFGKGNIYGARGIIPLEGTSSLSHNVIVGADYKDFSESVSVGANQGFNTPIHYLPFNVGYSATNTDKQGIWQAGGGVTFAVRGLASEESQFEDKRYKAQSNFTILKINLARTQNLSNGLVLYGLIEGQLTDQALISNEQFVAGGVDSVRGYLESTAVGDKGMRATVELRSPNLWPERLGWLANLQTFAFADGAGLYLNDPLPGQQSHFNLASVGLGLRLQAKRYASVSLDLGWPLTSEGQTSKGAARLHASGVIEF